MFKKHESLQFLDDVTKELLYIAYAGKIPNFTYNDNSLNINHLKQTHTLHHNENQPFNFDLNSL